MARATSVVATVTWFKFILVAQYLRSRPCEIYPTLASIETTLCMTEIAAYFSVVGFFGRAERLCATAAITTIKMTTTVALIDVPQVLKLGQ